MEKEKKVEHGGKGDWSGALADRAESSTRGKDG